MNGYSRLTWKCTLVVGLAFNTTLPIASAHADETVLYGFTRERYGRFPDANLLFGHAGELYGTTFSGGSANCAKGCGTVFKLAPDGKYEILHDFLGYQMNDGANPTGGLTPDSAGNLYGTTISGGPSNVGTVFNISSAGAEAILYSFCSKQNCRDGEFPSGNLIADKAGNLYGTTQNGGKWDFGTVYKLTASSSEKVMYSFKGNGDGISPFAGVVADTSGNLYGTTLFGGDNFGTVFELAADGTETVLHVFTGGSDGADPYGALILDTAGNLYGTTSFYGGAGYGTIFEISAGGTSFTTLYSFQGNDGESPRAALLLDQAGNLYGTTAEGGAYGYGTIFEFAPGSGEMVLHAFGGQDGRFPDGSLIADQAGNFYGTTMRGGGDKCGTGCGVVFELTP